MIRSLTATAPAVTTSTTGYLLLLCAVSWWQGMIGVLAKSIDVPAVPLVVGRCVVAALVLLTFARATGRGIGSGRRAIVGALVTGILLAAHWATLFMAYKLTDVALVVIGVFTFPVMAALSEPWFFGARPGWRQIAAACLVVLGVMVLRPVEGAAGASAGLTLAIISAACFCARNIISRKMLLAADNGADSIALMGWQAAIAVVVLSPSLIDPALFDFGTATAGASIIHPDLLVLGWWDLGMVVVLGLFFTAIPHTIGVTVMSRLSAATAGIVGSQQVISGILLAWLLLGEAVDWRVLLGASLVLGAVAWESLAKWREGRRLAAELAEAE
jgi:drug/metabolite transporter (DMT)-like permease